MRTSLDSKLDCHVRVITPENIEFEYALAGPFQRLPAFAFDFAIRVVAFFALVFLMALTSGLFSINSSLVSIVALLLFFFLSWFYGIYFETRFNGRTIGKMVFRLRVISTDGRPINGAQAALRNLLRLADMCVLLSLQIFDPEAPPAFLIPTMSVGLVVMTLSPKLQRLGDLAAGTLVVSEQRRSTPLVLQPEDLRAFGLAELIPANYVVSSSLAQTTGTYMENRRRLSPARRDEVAKHLAEPLLAQFGMLNTTSPDLLMCALYVRTFFSEQEQEAGRERLRNANSQAGNMPPQLDRTVQV
ncbi:RDD family protein [Aureliella helgolandensis]|uniref:RDD family protein n=1 Tax=Aureliella helgolandensis TaxID=2527968 RepID=A0A518G191_9BACT|nr:RDD family protein [Aureliella helgolandensis]QDV22346.1 RDD family protein [Aureliella helgolandensis]